MYVIPKNDMMIIMFTTSSNRLYDIEQSTKLTAGVWVLMMEDEPGTGANVSVVDTSDHPSAFYRFCPERP